MLLVRNADPLIPAGVSQVCAAPCLPCHLSLLTDTADTSIGSEGGRIQRQSPVAFFLSVLFAYSRVSVISSAFAGGDWEPSFPPATARLHRTMPAAGHTCSDEGQFDSMTLT